MPGFPNKFPGRCATCNERVAAQAGTTIKTNGKWLVYCADHDPGAVAMQISDPTAVRATKERAPVTSGPREQPVEPLRDRDEHGNYLLLSGHTASKYQAAVFDHFQSGSGSRIIRAVAGSGKTTTMKNAIRFLPEFTSVQMLAFNVEAAEQLKSAIEELKLRTGRAFAFVDAGTFHSVAMRALRSYLNLPNHQIKVKSNKLRWLFRDKLNELKNSTLLKNQSPEYLDLTYSPFCCKLVGLAKGEGIGALVPNERSEWQKLIDHHGLYLDSSNAEISHAIDLSIALLEWSVEAARGGSLDYDDMLYLISLWNIALPRNSVVICDEAQDTNPVRRAMLHLLLADGGRLYAVGDEKQSIYAFTGASVDAMALIEREFNCESLPLTVCYRCAQSIVDYAKIIDPTYQIESAPGAPLGSVELEIPLADAFEILDPTDAILCRNTAPLISIAYRRIAAGLGCRILGREIGQGLINLIEAQRAKDLDELELRLDDWAEKETTKFIKRGEEDRAEQVADRVECIRVVIDALPVPDRTIKTLCEKLSSMFDDKNDSLLTLCTMHKAKGKEWPQVVILRPDLIPSRAARQPHQLEQERNLHIVAVTRAKEHLYIAEPGDMAISNEKPAVSFFEKPEPVPAARSAAPGERMSRSPKINLNDLI